MLENIILIIFCLGLCTGALALNEIQRNLNQLKNEFNNCKYRAKCSNETKY